MIEFFNFSHLLNLQLDFLVWLQNIRNSYSWINPYFMHLTTLGEFYFPSLLCLIVYWCFDVINGIYLFSLFSMNVFITQIVKMFACVYRPWILSDKIKPSAEAIKFAGGYSFPSGHSAKVASVLGGLAVMLKNKYITILIALVILAVMFSRMWLGVHTLQDVIAGLLIGLILVFTLKPLVNWLENDKNRYLYTLGIINIFVLLTLLYLQIKPYPMDYIGGKLIVNPESSKYVSLICLSYALGLINGAFLCRRFLPFNTDIRISMKILRGVVGIILLNFIFDIMNKNFFGIVHGYKLTFCVIFLFGFILTAIYPLIFSCTEKLFEQLNSHKT